MISPAVVAPLEDDRRHGIEILLVLTKENGEILIRPLKRADTNSNFRFPTALLHPIW
jgi:hypothetical protein